MSPSPSALRAIEWLERQLADLGGIRNATSRDPIFKNWRQVTLTTLQRIWPGDQSRLERFLRIPFSPADARADLRAQREWYSRGCQEAARVLASYITDIREQGVPEVSDEMVMGVGGASGEFEVDFPTVDLPSGDLGSAAPAAGESQNPFADFVDSSPQASDAWTPAPPQMPRAEPAAPAAAGAAPARAEAGPRPGKKGLNMRARLLDLLGFSQLSAKAFSSPPRETPSSANLPSLDLPSTPAPQPARGLDIVPLGGAVAPPPRVVAAVPPASAPAPAPSEAPESAQPPTLSMAPSAAAGATETARPSGSWPLPKPSVQGADTQAPGEGDAAAHAPDPTVPGETAESVHAGAPTTSSATSETGETPPHEPGMSVVMSRPTTLRGAIGKVTIESLLSDQFRGSAPGTPSTPTSDLRATPAQPETPKAANPVAATPIAATPVATPPVAANPVAPTPVEPVPPVEGAPADAASTPEIELGAPVEELLSAAAEAQAQPAPAKTDEEVEPRPGPRSKVLPLPKRRPAPLMPDPEEEASDSAVGRVDPEAFARATEDFMRSSPVLGATGRRVKRGREAEREKNRERERDREDPLYEDPDAIAIASIMDDLDEIGVPSGRRNETRARLKDLAARIEKGQLEWAVLKKAVWFAMEYPELARRLVPVLLPWFDRAA